MSRSIILPFVYAVLTDRKVTTLPDGTVCYDVLPDNSCLV